MPLFILHLEDRILFDAAAPAVIAQVVAPPADGQSEGGQAPEGMSGAAADAGDTGDQQADTSSHDNSATTLVDAAPATQDAQVNVLLVSSGVANARQLADASAAGVITVVYDQNSTLAELQQQITDTLNGQKANTISFATEGQTGLFFLLKNLAVNAETLTSNTDLANFWKSVGEMLTSDGRVDLLGCFIAGVDGNDYGVLSALDALLDTNGDDHSVAASTDVTGNLPDGDWILEHGNIDAGSYFDADLLAQWTGKLATFTVTTNANSGAGSLRQAVADANAAAGADTIEFAIAANSLIDLGSSRLDLSGDLTIDGRTASGYVFGSENMVTLRCTVESLRLAGSSANILGLHIQGAQRINASTVHVEINVRGGNNLFRENVINAYNGSEGCGIYIVGGTNQIYGNYFGTTIDGSASDGTHLIGIQADAGVNTIGSGLAVDRNIFGDRQSGVQSFAGSAVNTVKGNYFGTDSSGTVQLLTSIGIFRQNSSATYNIGGTGAGEGNVFNSNIGVYLVSGGGITNVRGNYFGTDYTGTAAPTPSVYGGISYGVGVFTAGTTTIGGSTAAERNIFADSNFFDIYLDLSGATGTQIKGNYFGYDKDGNPFGTSNVGIYSSQGTGTVIGGTTAGERNYFSGKTTAIYVLGASTATILNNYIGTNIAGDNLALANAVGIDISSTAASTIGGTTSNLQNIISGNGIGIQLAGGTQNVIGNYIGLDVNGNELGNTGDGIRITGGTLHTIGNGDSTGRNIISGNGGDGINITNGTALIKGNYIGTNNDGDAVALFGNAGDGIDISSTSASTVGGINAGDRNIISGNANGVQLSAGTQNIYNNYIGTDVNGTEDLGNLSAGILITGGVNHAIGTTGLNGGNLISGNNTNGIGISGSASALIKNNVIGLSSTGNARANGQNGISISSTESSTIGGDYSLGEGNVISGNVNGISITGSGTQTITGNLIGTDASGTLDRGNTVDGIQISAGTNHIIGNGTTGGRNVISGNDNDGIQLSGAALALIKGNYFGTDVTGTAAIQAVPFTDFVNVGTVGIHRTSGSTGTLTIGGTNPGEGNLINGQTFGIALEGNATTNIYGNLIGTNAAGTGLIVGQSNIRGIVALNAHNMTIGGNTAAFRNIISGNVIGMELGNTGATQVKGNYIGLDVNGDALGNQQGIVVDAGTNHTIGTGTAGEGNYISSNSNAGVYIVVGRATVQGNIIGLNTAGAVAGNGFVGVYIFSNSSSTIGGIGSLRNIISGNNANNVSIGAGVYINASGAQTIIGNYIGTDINGSNAAGFGNINNGIYIDKGTGHNIGGSTAGQGNVISGNTVDGINITNAATANIRGNFIGTNSAGTALLGNGGDGIDISSSGASTVGGLNAGDRNIISGNANGIRLSNGTQTVLNNFIGTDESGTIAFGNTNGILVEGGTVHAIGNGAATGLNLISGNNSNGISITAGSALIKGNYIGLQTGGTLALGNTLNGISISSNATSTIGGNQTLGEGNVISGNNGDGILLTGGSQTIIGNLIGTDKNGADALANAGNGISITGGTNHLIGNGTTGGRNVISGNANDGISFQGGDGSIVQGNFIGTDASGFLPVGNVNNGIYILSGDNIVIGGSGAGEGNVISGNRQGMRVDGGTGLVVQGNIIGRNVDNTAALVNTDDGIDLSPGFLGATIGGIAAGEGNIIASNTDTGVHVNGATGVAIRGNSIFFNGGLGIDLANGGNNDQAAPTITSALYAPGPDQTTISFDFTAAVAGSYSFDFFSNPSSDSPGFEGRTYYGTSTQVLAAGLQTLTFIMAGSFPAGTYFTATATNTTINTPGNTSEFSNAVQYTTNSLPSLVNNTGVTVDEGSTVAITSAELSYTDAEQPASEIVYIVSGLPANGQFESTADQFNPLTTFTQEDINNGFIIYRHYGLENVSDVATFTIQDGQGGDLTGVIFNITVNPMNDAPTVGGDLTLEVTEGQFVVINPADLGYTDPDNTNGEITYSVTFLTNGYVAYGSNPALSINSFTQQDVIDGLVVFVHDGSETGDASFQFDVADLNSLPQANLVTVLVTHTNDSANVVLNFPPSIDENTPLDLQDRIAVTDADDQGGTVTVIISVDDGLLDVQEGATGVIVTNNGSSVTLEGTLAQISELLAGDNGASLTYNAADVPAGNVTFTVDVTDDQGANTNGTAAVVTINAQNDPFLITAPADVNMDEDTTHNFVNSIQLSDADLDNGTGEVKLEVQEGGVITLGDTSGLSSIDFTTPYSVLISGDLAALNAALNGVTWTPDPHFNGPAELIIEVNDGISPLTTAIVPITVNPVNDAPVVNGPASFAGVEDNPVVLSGISITDVDIIGGLGDLEVTLTVTHGTLTTTMPGLIVAGANGTATMTLNGSFDDVNTALASLVFTPDANFNSAEALENATLLVEVSDLGNTPGPEQLGDRTFQIVMDADNDAPTITVPANPPINEDTSLLLQPIVIDDIDSNTVTVTIEVDHGSLTFTDLSGITINDNGTATVTISGSLTDVNNALEHVLYNPDLNYNGNDNITVTAYDGEDSTTVVINGAITINSVNDSPTNDGSNSVDVNNGEGVQIGSDNLNITDVESPPGSVVYTITDAPNNGTLTLDGVPLHAGDQFTQENIRKGQIVYKHNGNGLPSDFMLLDVSDGDGASLSLRFDFNIKLVNLLAQPIILPNAGVANTAQSIMLDFAGNFHGNGFFNVLGNNQLTSFGDNMGLRQLARQGDSSMSFSIVNGEPQLSHRTRNTGFGDAVSALNYVIQHAGFDVGSSGFYEAIEELIDHPNAKLLAKSAFGKDLEMIAQGISKRFKR